MGWLAQKPRSHEVKQTVEKDTITRKSIAQDLN
jgi:hypothetical protein